MGTSESRPATQPSMVEAGRPAIAGVPAETLAQLYL
jgi:hypothetical protein